MAGYRLKRPPIIREDGTVQINLTKGRHVIVDAVDAHFATMNWSAALRRDGSVNAVRGEAKLQIWLHREILGLPRSDVTIFGDHKDGDTTNCRRCNLRAATQTINMRNRGLKATNKSGFVGVAFIATRGRWAAYISNRNIGYFDTALEANAARLAAEREEWGIHPQRLAAHAHAG